jgi:hypothetical protein
MIGFSRIHLKGYNMKMSFQCSLALALIAGFVQSSYSQEATDTKPTPVIFSTQEDHQNMLQQLGITKLRRGRDANQESEFKANYEEDKANIYGDLPDVLTLADGTKITTAEQWWKQRRPEIVEAFESEIVGRIPKNVPEVKWEVRETKEDKIGEIETIDQHIVGVVDNSACPEIEVNISMSLLLPKNATGPVPVLMLFGPTSFDPLPPWMAARRNANGQGAPAGPQGPTRESELIEAGWGVAKLNPSSVQDDSGGYRQGRGFGPNANANADANQPPRAAGLTRGIIGLCNLGQPRKPDDWGSLRAWGWGASRGLDYLLTQSTVDANRIGIEGVSRYGKAALVAMAFDERFAMVLIASSGEGGVSPYRREFGETSENLASSGAYHWMAGNFLKYSADESSFGSKKPSDMPVDSHQLIALCAPRLTFVSYGVPEKGDALWLDQQGSFMATIAAQPVFRLLGAKDLGRSDDYKSEKMPEVNVDLLDGDLAWRQHDGGHTDGPNIKHFIRWANARFADRTAKE